MSQAKRIVVTGIGPICSIGKSPSELWDSITRSRTHVVRKEYYEENKLWERFYIHALEGFSLDQFVNNTAILKWIADWKESKRDIDFELLSAAVASAISDSGLPIDSQGKDVGLVLFHENPGLEALSDAVAEAAYDALLECISRGDEPDKLKMKTLVYERCARLAYDTQTFMQLFFVAKLFGIHGYSVFLNNACASGLFALETAAQHVRSGRLSAAIVAGADCAQFVFKYLWFKRLKMYAMDGLVKPFAKDRNGLVFGEGAAGVVLEEYDSAKARHAHIYADYAGGGFSLESFKVSLPNVASGLYSDAMRESLRIADLEPKDIALINSHGIGDAVTDLHEARSVNRVFGDASNTPVTAFKPWIGHALGGSALLEVCILLLCLKHGYAPPILNCDSVDPRVHLNLVRSGKNLNVSSAMKLACGFAGYNAAAIFKSL